MAEDEIGSDRLQVIMAIESAIGGPKKFSAVTHQTKVLGLKAFSNQGL
jgi:hypothetical protein